MQRPETEALHTLQCPGPPRTPENDRSKMSAVRRLRNTGLVKPRAGESRRCAVGETRAAPSFLGNAAVTGAELPRAGEGSKCFSVSLKGDCFYLHGNGAWPFLLRISSDFKAVAEQPLSLCFPLGGPRMSSRSSRPARAPERTCRHSRLPGPGAWWSRPPCQPGSCLLRAQKCK